MIFGHQKNLKFLSRKISQGRLPHTLIFFGPEKIGKKKIAFEVGKYLLGKHKENSFFDFSKRECPCQGCQLIDGKKHPDFFEIGNENEISINQVREMQQKEKLSSKGFKVFIIDDAQRLTSEARGALLKILEEPRTKSIFFLITPLLKILPQTILSRSIVLKFPLFKREEVKKFLEILAKGKKTLPQKLEEILDFSLGRPGMAQQLSFDENKLGYFKDLFFLVREIKKMPLYERFLVAKNLERKKMFEDFLFLSSFFFEEILYFKENGKCRYFLTKTKEIKNLSQEFSKKEILEILKEILEIKNYISFSNVNRLLAMENLLLKI